MVNLTPEHTIQQVLETHPDLIHVFVANGLTEVKNDDFIAQFGRFLRLGTYLERKGLNTLAFIAQLHEQLRDDMGNSDITLRKAPGKGAGDIRISGLLPCPVRLPLLEALDGPLTGIRNSGQGVQCRLEAASGGFDWIRRELDNAADVSVLPHLFLSAGLDIFFEEDAFGKYIAAGQFHDPVPGEINRCFKDTGIADPAGAYGMIAVVPAVFLVNHAVLDDRPVPRTWQDLLDPIFTGAIALPVDDFDLFHALLIALHHQFGDPGIRDLARNMLASQHPAEMVKNGARSSGERAAVTVIPYFFTRMAERVSNLEWVWPEDGAIISPIFLISRTDAPSQVTEIARFLKGKEIGDILANGGLFPACHPDVNNPIPENATFAWPGWDTIRSRNMTTWLSHTEKLFMTSMQEVGK